MNDILDFKNRFIQCKQLCNIDYKIESIYFNLYFML